MSMKSSPRDSILIVDDEEGIRVALSNLFRMENYAVHTAENSASARSFFENGRTGCRFAGYPPRRR